MYLVKDEPNGTTCLVFTWKDPRLDGYTGDVVENVNLEYDMTEVHAWPNGAPRPEVCVGHDRSDPKHYKVFKYNLERQAASFEPVVGSPVVYGSWLDYLKLRDPQRLPEEDWYEVLDEYDEAARQRGRREELPDEPSGGNPYEIAAWLAKTHFIVDSAIREVWYLPKDSPPNEIRLLEVSDRLAGGDNEEVAALDFGLDLGGQPLRLFVADVTTDQLANIRHGSLRLPPDWSLDGAQNWRRRGA